MSYECIFSDSLSHHGIKGQKWGVRRFRNEDGTLTNDGKERYSDKNKKRDTAKKVAIGVGITGTVALGAYVVHKNRQYIRNKASKRQIEIGKKAVIEALEAKNQSDMNYRFLKTSGDIKGAIKEKRKARNYGKLAKKLANRYPREAYKLKTGKYKKAKDFLNLNSKPIDYLESFAEGAAIGIIPGTVIGRKINKNKKGDNK